jgi:pimeloyl-ACP methyl ester carboxylesterase
LLQLFTRKKAYTNAALFRSMVQDKPLKEWNQINQISCPTLVLSCEGDPVHPYKMGVELASYIQGANHEKVASRYTHNLQYQKDCFTAITKFVTSLTL